MKKYSYPIILIVFAVIIFATNYQAGTYLLGWDNFNSELNPGLAVSQALSAGWSDFRSFGLVAGMGYGTDLIHAVFVWLVSFILPSNTIRYLFHTVLLAIGALGSYALFTRLRIGRPFAFLGSLSYMLNFGTIQMFNLPYEPFSMFFGFLPWALFAGFGLMEQVNKKTLLAWAIANILLSGAFYVQTMFVVYVLLLGSMNILYFLEHRDQWSDVLKKTLLLWSTLILVNAYWIFTQLYFLTDTVSFVREAKQTLLGWRIPFFQNKAHGTILDFFTQKGYYSDFEGKNGLIFAPWLAYLSQPLIRLGQLFIIGLVFIGILDGTNRYKRYFLLILFVCTVALLMDMPILREMNAFVRQSGFIDQVFRSPFSKFASVTSLALGYFLALGSNAIWERMRQKKLIGYSLVPLVGTVIIVLSFPIFQGQFFSPEVKVTLPSQYSELFDFFRHQDRHARIALLPEMNVWGWYVYKWGYIGSGFLWHGIEQPIISRSYDVWNRTSENYYLELTNAVSRENVNDLIRVFQKYNITYLIVDYSITINPESVFKLQKMVQLLEEDSRIRKASHMDTIDVYKLTDSSYTAPFATSEPLPNIGPRALRLNNDIAFKNNGWYETKETSAFDLYYPFLDLQTATFDPKKTWGIVEHANSFEITAAIPADAEGVPTDAREMFVLEKQDDVKMIEMNILIRRVGNTLTVQFPKITIDKTNETQPEDCSIEQNQNPSRMMTDKTADGTVKVWTSDGTKACWGYHFDTAPERYAYLLRVISENISGLPATMHGIEHTHQQVVLEHQLNTQSGPYFILPIGPPDGRGFSINFQNFSFVRTRSENVVSAPLVYLFPQLSLQNIVLGSRNDPVFTPIHPFTRESVQRLGPWGYILTPTTSDSTLLFMQAFDPGWTAWERTPTFPYLRPLQNHVLVNNWENGWTFGGNEEMIVVFFWPQVLQWIGFILLPLPFVLTFTKSLLQ